MENASKALLMAAGILIGVLMLALMVTLFLSSSEVSNEYEQTKKSEAVQQFNVNFTQYLGQDLSIHQVITMKNFALNNKVCDVTVANITSTIDKDMEDLNQKYQEYLGKKVKLEIIYKIENIEYDEVTGYVSKVSISNRKLKIIEYNEDGTAQAPRYETL